MLLLFQSSGLCVKSPSTIPVPGYPLCLVSWVRCGTWLYQFLIFAPLLTLIIRVVLSVLLGGPKGLPALSFNALIIPILRIVCTISVHYLSSMSCILAWVRCGTWLYQFRIFAPLLILANAPPLSPSKGLDPGLQTKISLDMFQYLLHLCLHTKNR